MRSESVSRRAVLGLSVSGLLALTGCNEDLSGELTAAEERNERLQQTVEEQRSQLEQLEEANQELEGTAAARQTAVEDLEEQLESARQEATDAKSRREEVEQQLEEVENDLEATEEEREETRQEIVAEVYRRAVRLYGFGESAFDDARTSYQNNNFVTTTKDAATAFGQYNAATDEFLIVIDLCDRFGYSEASETATASNLYCSNGADAANAFALAAEHYAREEYDEGDSDRESANSSIEAASEYQVQELRTFRQQLQGDQSSGNTV